MRTSPRGDQVGIAGNQRHRFRGNAQPFAEQLHKARFVALPGRKSANCHGDGLVGQDLHDRLLMRRAACRFDVAAGADAAMQTLRPRGCAARLEAAPIGEGNRIIEDFLVVAAVVGHAERVDVGQCVGRNEFIRRRASRSKPHVCAARSISRSITNMTSGRPALR